MTEPNFSAIRARLRYQSVDDFIEGYAPYVSAGGMFIPMAPAKLKPVGTTVRFQFILGDGVTALLGEGVVRKIRGMESQNEESPAGMLVRFTKLSQDSKLIVDQIIALKALDGAGISLGIDSKPKEEAPAPSAPEAQQASDSAQARGELDEAVVKEALRMTDGDESPEERVTSHEDNTAERSLDGSMTSTRNVSEAESVEAEQDANILGFWDDDDEIFGGGAKEAAAPEPEPEEEPVPESEPEPEPVVEEQVASASEEPRALRDTEAGFKVIAFDDGPHDDEAAREFENFAFGGDEDDVDEMLDSIFGGDDGDDFFGGVGEGGDFFGGGDAGEPAGFEEAEAGPEPVVAEAEAEAKHEPVQSGALGFDEVAEESADGDRGESPIVAGLTLDSVVEYNDDEFLLEEGSEALDATSFIINDDEPEDESEDGPIQGLPEEVSELIDLGGFSLELGPEEEQAQEPLVEEAVEEVAEEVQTSDELLSLLGSMEEFDGEEEDELSLSVGLSASPPPAPREEDEELGSFSALIASAQKELDSKQEPAEENPKDILDELLGDDDLTFPVTSTASPFAMPDKNKKKKGFISKLFGKD